MTDYYYVDCEEYREALSARLDDEESPVDAGRAAEDHLERCAGCAVWYDHAALITRRTRTTAAVSWPDVADAVLTRVPVDAPDTPARLRAALGTVGAAQGATALFALAAGGGYTGPAWHLALGVAFCAVAAGRAQPAGLLPLLATFVGVRTVGLLAGDASGGDSATLAPYALSVVGLVLVVLLHHISPTPRTTPPRTGAAALVRGAESSDKSTEDRPVAIARNRPTKAA